MENRSCSCNKVLALVLALVAVVLGLVPGAWAKPWKFGILGDTQWAWLDDGRNPNSCAAGIIRQMDQEFIKAGVKLVIAVGDTVNKSSKINIDSRALYAQDLYNAGIGFYPLRGNHEACNRHYLDSGLEFQHAFPQLSPATAGLNNATPADISRRIIPARDLEINPPARKTGAPFTVGANFSYPTAVNQANKSISYAFDYRNARFILLDQFDGSGDPFNSTIPAQQPWLEARLSDSLRPLQVFVFAHKNLLGRNHKDNLFGGPVDSSDPGDGSGVKMGQLRLDAAARLQAKRRAEDAFITALADHNVRLFISGHDHLHSYSLVRAPLTPGKSIQQLIAQSASSKFYAPRPPFSANEVPLAEDLYRIGYYIVTVDGPQVTVAYYASDVRYPHGLFCTRVLHFVKRGSFGYNLNDRLMDRPVINQ